MDKGISPELLQFLQQQNWVKLYPALVDHAERRLNWIGLPKEGVQGKNAKVIVSEAMEKVYTGIRKPKPKDLLDFEFYMGSVINSLISALKKSKENRIKSNEDVETLSDEQLVDYMFDDGFITELEIKEILDKIEKEILDDGDDDMYLVYCGIRQGSTNEELAKDLKRSVQEIVNIKKRLSRLFLRTRAKK